MNDEEQSTRKALFAGTQAKKVVDLNHRCYSGSLWISYFGSRKLVDKREPYLCVDTPNALSLLLTWHILLSG